MEPMTRTFPSLYTKLDRLQIDVMRVISGSTERSNKALLYGDFSWPTLDSKQLVTTSQI